MERGSCLLILDGLDELPVSMQVNDRTHYPRRNLISGLTDALPRWTDTGNRVLLTSRSYGLNSRDRQGLGLTEQSLGELLDPLQHTFIRRWFAAADYTNRETKSTGLIEHLGTRDDLRELRANPMLLTALCVKYDEGRRLPQDVYKLYGSVVNQVLYNRFADQAKEVDPARRRLAAVALGMHGDQAIPIERETPAATVSVDEIDRILAAYAQGQLATEGGVQQAADRRETLLSRSGLLMPSGERKASFYHLSFQEFLAAERLEILGTDIEVLLARRAGTAEWRRTLVFFFCAVAERNPQAALDGYASLLDRLESQPLKGNPNPALLLSDYLEIAHARGWCLDDFAAPYRTACDQALEIVEPPARARLWDVLGLLGLDDRSGIGLDKNSLPLFDWIAIPGGNVKIEGKGTYPVKPFHIARHPVTQAQFAAFVKADDGFRNPVWWDKEWIDQGWIDLERPPKARWPVPNRPMESVSWYEAAAFCLWSTARLGFEIRLPGEMEWQQAATGSNPENRYPWGRDYQSGYANIDEEWGNAGPFRIGQSSPVGLYPKGASVQGTLDLAGNVWEWCLNKYDDAADISSGGEDLRSLRGGSWIDYQDGARAASRNSRNSRNPDGRYGRLGFRVCCVSPIDEH